MGANAANSPEGLIVRIIEGKLGGRNGAGGNVPFFNAKGDASVQAQSTGLGDSMKEIYQNYLDELKEKSPSKCENTGNIASTIASIESLLVSGKREEAAELALKHQQWGMALLIGSICSTETYQSIVKSFSKNHFPATSPMNLMSSIFANQSPEECIASIRANPSDSVGIATKDQDSQNKDKLFVWLKYLSAVISNKSQGWKDLLRLFGEQYKVTALSKQLDRQNRHVSCLCTHFVVAFDRADVCNYAVE